MATNRTFSALLDDYVPDGLLKEEMKKRNYVYQNIEKDESWSGASSTTGEAAYVVKFKGAQASSIAFGALADTTDISKSSFVRGRITTQPELWGSLQFDHRDIMENDTVSERKFLNLLPDELSDFMDFISAATSQQIMSGGSFAELTADGDTGGTGLMTVDRPERFEIGQKISLDDDNSSAQTLYVTAVNMNTAVVTVSDTRGGSAFSISGYTTAQNAVVYHQGSQSSGFTSIKNSLLSSANGGGTTLYGVTKTSYSYTQAINVDGSTITAVNIMEKIFDAMTTIERRGKGKITEAWLSLTNFGSCQKVIENSKGSFNVKAGDNSAVQYGWQTITIGNAAGRIIKLVGLHEMDDDYIPFIDWRALVFASNGGFRKRKSPDGIMYFESRATTGYSYIVDMCIFGDVVVKRPSYCGVLYSISY